jgi:hypothetical protein
MLLYRSGSSKNQIYIHYIKIYEVVSLLMIPLCITSRDTLIESINSLSKGVFKLQNKYQNTGRFL